MIRLDLEVNNRGDAALKQAASGLDGVGKSAHGADRELKELTKSQQNAALKMMRMHEEAIRMNQGFSSTSDKAQRVSAALGQMSTTATSTAAALGLPIGQLGAFNAAADLAGLSLTKTAAGFNAASVGVVGAGLAIGIAIGTLLREIPLIKNAMDSWAESIFGVASANEEAARTATFAAQKFGKSGELAGQVTVDLLMSQGKSLADIKKMYETMPAGMEKYIATLERFNDEQERLGKIAKDDAAQLKKVEDAAIRAAAALTERLLPYWEQFQAGLDKVNAMAGGPSADNILNLGKQGNYKKLLGFAPGGGAIIEIQTQFERVGDEAGLSFAQGMKDSLGSLPQVILGVFQGGGNLGQSIGALFGKNLFGEGSGFFKSLTGPGGFLSKGIGAAFGSIIPGLGTLLGGGLGSLVGKLFGGLFGGGPSKEEIEKARKEQEQLRAESLKTFEDLQRQIKDFKLDALNKGVAGLTALFKNAAATTHLTRLADKIDANGKHMKRFREETSLTQERLDRLGLVGVAMFEELRRQGMGVVDALKEMAPALDAAVAAADKAGLELSGTLAVLVEFSNRVLANEDLVNAVDGWSAAFLALEATGNLNVQTFAAMDDEIQDLIASLEEQGFTHEQILAMAGPGLYQLFLAQKKYGLAVDETTQALIDEAEKAGLFEDLQDPMEKLIELQGMMLQAVAALVTAFGATLPEAVQKYIDMLNKVPNVPGPPAMPGGGTGGNAGNGHGGEDQEEIKGSKAFGGPIHETGLYRLHAGERVLPPGSFEAGGPGGLIPGGDVTGGPAGFVPGSGGGGAGDGVSGGGGGGAGGAIERAVARAVARTRPLSVQQTFAPVITGAGNPTEMARTMNKIARENIEGFRSTIEQIFRQSGRI